MTPVWQYLGLTPAQVHARMAEWSLITVRHALRQLVEEGRAAFTGPNQSRLYRRVA